MTERSRAAEDGRCMSDHIINRFTLLRWRKKLTRGKEISYPKRRNKKQDMEVETKQQDDSAARKKAERDERKRKKAEEKARRAARAAAKEAKAAVSLQATGLDNKGAKAKAEPVKEKALVGVVGTSRHGLVEKSVAKDTVYSALDEAAAEAAKAGKEVAIVSGGGLVPKLAFQWAAANGCSAKQVVSAAVRSTPSGVERIEIGKNYGDESEVFVGMVDILVRVGGGPQSHDELRRFRDVHPQGHLVERELTCTKEIRVCDC